MNEKSRKGRRHAFLSRTEHFPSYWSMCQHEWTAAALCSLRFTSFCPSGQARNGKKTILIADGMLSWWDKICLRAANVFFCFCFEMFNSYCRHRVTKDKSCWMNDFLSSFNIGSTIELISDAQLIVMRYANGSSVSIFPARIREKKPFSFLLHSLEFYIL